ncbi:MAG: 4-hydroxy-tetrahydrodipicolinate reductase [Flavobacteriales bacterium]
MRIALSGYGKMGKAIEHEALERGHTIGLKLDSSNEEIDPSAFQGIELMIDFSTPKVVAGNIHRAFDLGIPVVVGTTGWEDEFDALCQRCDKEGQTLFHAPNFSIGVNLFFAVNRYLAGLMNEHPEYDVEVDEIHHKEKKDAPSGTAVRIAKDLLEALDRKADWVKEKADDPARLKVGSERKDDVKGTHTVRYASPIDDITIQHKARSRKGFALGAVLAAEWVKDRKGLFTMRDMLDL